MYPIKPRHVYIHERVMADPLAERRMQRMIGGIEPDEEPDTVDDAMGRIPQGAQSSRRGRIPRLPDSAHPQERTTLRRSYRMQGDAVGRIGEHPRKLGHWPRRPLQYPPRRSR